MTRVRPHELALGVLLVHEAARRLRAKEGWVSVRSVCRVAARGNPSHRFVVDGQLRESAAAEVLPALEAAVPLGLLERLRLPPGAAIPGWPAVHFRVSRSSVYPADDPTEPPRDAEALESPPASAAEPAPTTDARTVQLFEHLRNAGQARSTTELVDALGWPRTTLRRALAAAVEAGRVGKGKSGTSAIYWALVDKAPRPAPRRESAPPPTPRRALGRVPESWLEANGRGA